MKIRILTNALQMEQSFGCKLSPYAQVLLDNLSNLVKEQIELNSREQS